MWEFFYLIVEKYVVILLFSFLMSCLKVLTHLRNFLSGYSMFLIQGRKNGFFDQGSFVERVGLV